MAEREATCTGCGCTDSRACVGGCGWYRVDRRKGTGICTACVDKKLDELTTAHTQRIADARQAIATLRKLDEGFVLRRRSTDDPGPADRPTTVLGELVERLERALDSSDAPAGR